MSVSSEGRGLRAAAWVLASAAVVVALLLLVRRPLRREVTVVYPSIVSLVRSTPDYVSAERTYWIEEREIIETPLWSSIEIMRRYPVMVRAEVACDAFGPGLIASNETESTRTVTIRLPHAALQPPVIDLEGSYRPAPDADRPGAVLVPAEERAEAMARYDALMEQNARTAALDLAMSDGLVLEAESNTAADMTAAVRAILMEQGFEDFEVIVVFGDFPEAPLPASDPPRLRTGG